ncbi:hypothetical protein [Mycobacterium haemophilum]|nr:hypothetical protein [Mycobacterium haemophilum]
MNTVLIDMVGEIEIVVLLLERDGSYESQIILEVASGGVEANRV